MGVQSSCMKDKIIMDLSGQIEESIIRDLVETYEELVARHRTGDLEAALTKGGRFVEHALRAIEFVRTKKVLTEIKSVQHTIREIENDTTLPESLRFLIPRAANGMIYSLRSKRNAVHVKEIDPTPIDVSLTVAAASWIIAELLRLYHVSDDRAVEQAMAALTRTAIPLIEAIGGEIFVGENVPASKEILLLLAHAKSNGMSRREIGIAAKCSQPSVTKSLQSLEKDRLVHLSARELYHITNAGEQVLADWLVTSRH
jgi:hypothetical protein